MRRIFWGAAVLGLLLAVPGETKAGLLVVSGDENITNALVGNAVPVNPGNQQFFLNVLGSGHTVLVHGTDPGGVDTPNASTNAFYNSIPGVNSSILSGAVTPAALAGVNLFVSAIPSFAYSPNEVAALSAFSAAGGTIFLMGDHAGFAPAQDANLNALLLGLGSSLHIVPDILDTGFHTATGSQIATDPLTSGVSSFSYAAVSQVTGGTPLFFTTGGQTFIAREGEPPTAAVPEPSTVALLGVGVAGLVAYTWRRRRVVAA
jgi:hypothetical protein